jgi:hypothetical protein
MLRIRVITVIMDLSGRSRMTIKELRKALEAYPEDAVIFMYNEL